MPNEVECTLMITGDPDDVRNCLASIGSPGSESDDARLFDFDRVVPLPRTYRARADVLSDTDEVPPQVVVSAWGTKWNAYGVTIDDRPDGGRARIRFRTAWAPPRPVIATLAERFPNLGFDLTYFDDMGMIAGRLRRARGDQVWATLEARYDYGFCDAVLGAESRVPWQSDSAAGPLSTGPEAAVRGADAINHNDGLAR
jgi:hypothetical protein